MKDSSVYIQLHPIIDNILYRIQDHDYQIGINHDILNWDKEHEAKWELSDDETKLNQNRVGRKQRMDKEFVNHARLELEYHKREFENAKILLRIYMDAFNDGWQF